MATILNEESGLRVGQPSIGWTGKHIRTIAAALWAAIRKALTAYRRHRVAEVLYSEMSRLPDADLRRLGVARGDLYAWAKQMSRA
jgi:hypothetical protein